VTHLSEFGNEHRSERPLGNRNVCAVSRFIIRSASLCSKNPFSILKAHFYLYRHITAHVRFTVPCCGDRFMKIETNQKEVWAQCNQCAVFKLCTNLVLQAALHTSHSKNAELLRVINCASAQSWAMRRLIRAKGYTGLRLNTLQGKLKMRWLGEVLSNSLHS
jgi:hypothetical protein